MMVRVDKAPPGAESGDRGQRPLRLSFGHAGRLGLTSRTRWLLAAQILVFVLSQAVDEIVEWIAGIVHLAAPQAAVLEVTLGLVMFLLWSACMVAWVEAFKRRGGDE